MRQVFLVMVVQSFATPTYFRPIAVTEDEALAKRIASLGSNREIWFDEVPFVENEEDVGKLQ